MQLQRPVLKAKIWIAVIEKKPLYLQGRGLFPCSSSLFLEGKSAPDPFGALGLLGATQVEGEKEKNPLDPCRINLFRKEIALAGVSQWIECWPANQRVAGSIPSQAHAWVVGQVPIRGM